MPDGGSVGINIVPDFSGFGALFSRGIRGALVQADSLGKEAGKVFGGGLRQNLALGLAGAGVALGEFVLGGIRRFSELADSTRSLQRVTGGTAEEVSLFAGVLKQLGVNTDGVSRGLLTFGAHIAAQPELFAKYGVAIAHTKDGQDDLIGTLNNVRNAFVGTTNATDRDAAAKELLGKASVQLLPYLLQTNDALALRERIVRNSGGAVSDTDLAKVRELKIQTQELKDEYQQLQVAAGRAATGFASGVLAGVETIKRTGIFDLPRILAATVTGQTNLIPAHIRQAVQDELGLSRAAAEVELAMRAQTAATAQADSELRSLAGAAEGVRAANTAVTAAQARVGEAERGVAAAHRATQSAIEGVAKAQQGVTAAHENAQRAAESVVRAQADLNKLEQQGAVDAKAVADAQRGVDGANRSARDAVEALAAAQQHLNDVQEGATADQLADATLRLRSADIALKEARLAQGQPGSSTDPYAGAQAKLAVDQAVQARTEAQEELTRVQQQGTASDQNVVDAQRQVRDASERVTDATTAQADAQAKLREAQAGDPEFDQKIADAKDAVAAASRGVRDAAIEEHDAAVALQSAQQAVVDARQGEVDAAAALVKARDDVTEATYRARDAQYALDGEWDKATQLGAGLAKVLDDLKAKYPELAGVVAAASTKPGGVSPAAAAGGAYTTPDGFKYVPVPQADLDKAGFPRRAGGGDVVPGQAYLVGERGPEILQDGRVYPSGQAPPALSAGPQLSDLLHAFAEFVATPEVGGELVLPHREGSTLAAVIP